MRVAALFTDYDGTIAPENVPREVSRVPEPIASRLELLSSKIPVAIVTSKDLAFVRPRTTFARAWACVMGMEVCLSEGTRFINKGSSYARIALQRVERLLPRSILVERKKASDGSLLGITLDWTHESPQLQRDFAGLEAYLRSTGLYVLHPEGSTFLDVFAAPPDKGSAVLSLVKMLNIAGPVMYLGNSQPDNAAFDVSDIPVGVYQSKPVESLHCRFSLRYSDVPDLLHRLIQHDLQFSNPLLKSVDRRRSR